MLRIKLTIARQTRMADWLAYRSVMLDEMLRLDGLGDSAALGVCFSCLASEGEYRCSDCFGGNMHCSECILSSHRHLPLHRVQVCHESLSSQKSSTDLNFRSGPTGFSSVYPSRVLVLS